MECDILVIGAGALGISSALHIKEANPDKRVVIVDMYGGPGQGNSAKSEGAFRNLFTSETNFLLADSTIDYMGHLQSELGRDIKLAKIGYLWLFSEAQFSGQRAAFDKMEALGAEIEILGKEDLERKIPDLVTSFEGDEDAELLGLNPVDVGVHGFKCGGVDADALVKALEKEFLKIGGEIQYNTEVKRLILKPEEELDLPGEPFVWQNSRFVGAETSRGPIEAGTTVVAAGVWAGKLLDPIGFDSMMRPKKRQLFSFKDPKLKGLMELKDLNEYAALPLTVLPKSGVYLKAEVTEGSIWLGCADNIGRGFGLDDDPQPEEGYYTDNVYHVVVKYFPCFEDVRPVNMWAGQYAINSYDGIPVVAPAPGMIYVGAASGSGIMKCDALGRIAAALYVGEKEATLYGDRRFRVADLGIGTRNVVRESLVI
ncbi:MAG TPA: FAD-binding oxidoreductase [Patescibacteria group bacterium]|nr:FAD-binding oxidoreductase [Patescibacteria group bacterium]